MTDFLFKLPRDEETLKDRLSPRKKLLDRSLIADITTLFNNVEVSGDEAIKEATEYYDKIKIESVKVTDEYVEQCLKGLSPQFKKAVETVVKNIKEMA